MRGWAAYPTNPMKESDVKQKKRNSERPINLSKGSKICMIHIPDHSYVEFKVLRELVNIYPSHKPNNDTNERNSKRSNTGI